MVTTALVNLLTYASLPPRVQDMAAAAFPGHHDALAKNQSLTVATSCALYQQGIPVGRAYDLALRFWHPAQVAHALGVVGETRERPLYALLRHWNLTQDQLRTLASAKVSANLATELLSRAPLEPADKVALLRRVPVKDRIKWLNGEGTGLADDIVWAQLDGLSEDALNAEQWIYVADIANVLHPRPALWTKAATSEWAPLLDAVASFELDHDTQHQVLASATTIPSAQITLLNLLDQPSTCPEVRRDAWDLLVSTATAYRDQIPGVHSPYAISGRLRDEDDPTKLELIVGRSTMRQYRSTQWLELAYNPNLSEAQAARLAYHLGEIRMSDTNLHSWHTTVEDFIGRWAQCCDVQALRYHVDSYTHRAGTSDSELMRRTPGDQATRRSGAPPSPPYTETGTDPRWLQDDLVVNSPGRSTWGADTAMAGAVLTSVLGDEVEPWRVAMTMADDFTGNVGELAEIAQLTIGAPST